MEDQKDGVMLALAAGGVIFLLATAEIGAAAAVVGVSMSAVSGYLALKNDSNVGSRKIGLGLQNQRRSIRTPPSSSKEEVVLESPKLTAVRKPESREKRVSCA